ncbi:sensor histidine kinase [Clostridium botulinum]|nr:sensor histidine kinase [Clostridium botulinum]
MSLIKLISSVLKKEKVAIIVYLVNMIVLLCFYYLLFNSKEIVYPLIISLFFLMIYVIYKTFKYKEFYTNLKEAKSSPNYERILHEEKEVFQTINEIHDTYINKFYKMENKLNERDKLLAQWIHNMKTSIAVIGLACEKGKKDIGDSYFLNDILEENKKLQENLEEALNLFRLDEFSKDYIPEKVNLKELVNSSINNKKREFIYKKVFPKVNIHRECYIYTDKKWAEYMLEQIISNAIKYTDKQDSYVVFSIKEKENYIILSIKDSGIGIKKEDIPRIFEPFFTGNNGRKNNKSSGIGLYMAKQVSDELGHKINIKSKVGDGTTVEIKCLSKL